MWNYWIVLISKFYFCLCFNIVHFLKFSNICPLGSSNVWNENVSVTSERKLFFHRMVAIYWFSMWLKFNFAYKKWMKYHFWMSKRNIFFWVKCIFVLDWINERFEWIKERFMLVNFYSQHFNTVFIRRYYTMHC